MKIIKKLTAVVLALIMIMSITAIGFAAGETSDATLQDDMTGQGNLDIYGVVEPINMIDITLPVNGLRFTIKADRTIVWTDDSITSRCPAPLDINMIDAGVASTLTPEESAAGYNSNGAPALAADDLHDDWDNLTRAQTKANIAISVNEENISTASTENIINRTGLSLYEVVSLVRGNVEKFCYEGPIGRFILKSENKRGLLIIKYYQVIGKEAPNKTP